MILTLALAVAVQTASPVHMRQEPYPWLAQSGYMKTWYWFCDRMEAEKDPQAKQRLAKAIRQMRHDYQGDLSQRAYKCWTDLP